MNDGFVNEIELRDYINSHNYVTYNDNIRSFLRFTFGEDFSEVAPFHSAKVFGRGKPDLKITHNNTTKYISVKKGSGNSVHQEGIDVFFPYVQTLIGLPALNYLKKFHYGDDTIDDTGTIRYSAAQCKGRYREEITLLNNTLNRWTVLNNFLDRFLFDGNVGTNGVDVVYHGNIDSGLWASRDEIRQYIRNNNFSENAVHFGPLTYQVWGRNDQRTAVHPERRYVMQIKWGKMENDFRRIRGIEL